MYVYFIFVGYRVSIGKTINIPLRMSSYRRTHFEVNVLGVIPCQSKKELNNIENQILKHFQFCNAFRDMFYLAPEMRDWIVKNTIPMPVDTWDKFRQLRNEALDNEEHREKRRKYRSENREQRSEYNRQWRKRNRRKGENL